MKTFNQFICERVRTKKEATKLGLYLSKRHGGGIIRNKNHDEKTGDYLYGKAYKDSRDAGTNLHAKFHNSETHKLPIKSIKVTQSETAFNKTGSKRKFNDKEPIKVIHHKGVHYVVDGHHRIMAHKLLGKKHIDAKVIHVKE